MTQEKNMKILHTSDLHLGSALTSRLSPARIRERKAELIQSFERQVEEGLMRGVRIFIIAGDLFDTERVGRGVKESVISVIRRASSIDFLYLPGNHERLALFDGSVEIPENLKLFREDWTYFDYDYVTVAGKTALGAGTFDGLELDPGRKNIVVLHGGIADRSGEDTVGLADAAGRGIDYLALGHYHSYSCTRIDSRGIAVYSGTPEGRGFDEAGECGFCIVDTNGSELYHSFIPHAKRRILIRKADVSDVRDRADVDSAVAAALDGVNPCDLVRVVLTGRHAPEVNPDLDTIRKRYEDRYYHFEAEDESGLRIDPEEYRYDRSLKGEFIRLVLGRCGLADEERDAIIRAGLGALMGDLGDL